jgi:flagella basal body P-ring formation protein FlgA
VRRILAIVALVALVPSAAAEVTGVSLTPRLKPAITVATDLVRVGDLVENAGAAANVPVFRSPDLGDTGVVSINRVLAALRPHHLTGVETNGASEVSVTRASRAVGVKELEARIVRALAGQYGLGDANNLSVIFDREVRLLHFEPSTTAELNIARLTYDQRTSRFDVALEMPGSLVARRMPLRFSGSVLEMLATPVLARALARGDVIKAADLVIERRRKIQTPEDAVNTIEQAVGLAARRPLRVGQPLRQSELMKPEIVQRNETVTLVYEVPGILLTVRGKALESGTEGDVVNVLNIQSKRTVQGTVSGPGRVDVTARTPHAASSTLSTAKLDTATTPHRNPE